MRTAATIALALILSGCAGLNVAWVLQASYNTPAATSATITTGAVPPAVPASGAK